MILVTALAWAGYSVVGKPLFGREPSLAATFHITWIGTLSLIPLAVREARRLRMSGLSPSAWLAVVYMGVFCSAACSTTASGSRLPSWPTWWALSWPW